MASVSSALVGITQRVVPVPSRAERRDTLDQAWVPFLEACGLEAVMVPNRHRDPAAYLRRLGVRGIVLSGGGNVSGSLGTLNGEPPGVLSINDDLSPERDVTETALLRASLEEGWPVLGVCRGMQALNVFHGGHLVTLAGHAGNRHTLSTGISVVHPRQFRFDDEVNSFHDCGVAADSLGAGLLVLATADGCPEAVIHEQLPHLGIMWHPERNRPFSNNDIALFRDFFGGALN